MIQPDADATASKVSARATCILETAGLLCQHPKKRRQINGHEKGTKGKLKVLNLNKETVKNLSEGEAKGVKGGVINLSLVGGGSRTKVRATSTL